MLVLSLSDPLSQMLWLHFRRSVFPAYHSLSHEYSAHLYWQHSSHYTTTVCVQELTLLMGETKDLAVYAVPVEDQFSPDNSNAGLVADSLVCTIQNNPHPVSFGLSAVGVTPQV